MFDLGSIFVRIKAKTEEFESGMQTVKKTTEGTADNVNKLGVTAQKLGSGFVAVGAMGAGGLFAIKQGVDQSLDAANRFQSSMIGLSSLARAFGEDADAAKQAAMSLAQDGLMSVSDAATGLKNLLAAGFSLDQAIELMTRFKDSAAFARQGSLSFGEAIRGATEGIKNGNSILVDNAGVTKNLSLMLEEAGFSAQDLMKASTDAGVRQAIFNGILKETKPQLGDAARLSDTFAGAQSRLAVDTEKARQKLGEALQPALTKVFEVITPVIKKIAEFAEKNPKLVAVIVILTAALSALAVILGIVGAAILFVTAVGAPILGIIALIVLAVAALIAIGILLWQNWDTIMNAIVAAWQFFYDMVSGILNAFFNFVSGIWNAIYGAIAAIVGAIWNNIISPYLEIWKTAFMIFYNVVYYIFAVIRALVTVAFEWLWNNVISPYINLWKAAFNIFWTVVSAVFNAVMGVARAAANVISGAFQTSLNFVMNIWNGIVGWFSGLWNKVIGTVSGIGGKFSQAFSGAFEGVKGIFTGAVNWIIDKINGVINTVNNTAGKLPGVPKIGNIPRLFTGVRNFAGGMAFLAEQGPELVTLPKGANVYNAGETDALLSGATRPIVQVMVDNSGANITSPQVAEQYGEAIGDAIVRKLANTVRI